MLASAAACLLTVDVGASLWHFPVLRLPLMVGFALYAAALWRWPGAWLWVLPAILPVLDLAPLSGRFFLDEFDLAVQLTVAVALWRDARSPWPAWTVAGPGGRLAWALLGLSVAVSAALALQPEGFWPWPSDANQVASELSRYNALRIAKGFAAAFALIALLPRSARSAADATRQLAGGIVLGLAGATLLALWERWAYPGLFDFSSSHRVGAFFSSMHNGGSHIEAFLVLALPFLVVVAALTRHLSVRLAAAGLFIAAVYVLMVTFARGGYGAGALALGVVIGLLARGRKPRRAALVSGGVALLLTAALAASVLGGRFAQQRLATSAADLDTRSAHWRETLRLMDPGAGTTLFGMGLGRFPDTWRLGNASGHAPASFAYGRDAAEKGGATYLRLGAGDTLYVEQFVDLRPQRPYRLALAARSPGGPAQLNALLCERTYFISYGCVSATFAVPGPAWAPLQASLNSQALGAGGALSRRPVKLSLENTTPGTVIELRALELTDLSGEGGNANLVRNGDFAAGGDHWFFSSNFNHLPWHVKNLWLGLYFDQGLLGVAALALLLLSTLAGAMRAAWRGQPFAAAAVAAALGFLAVGLFDSLFDAPRLTTLFLLVLAVGAALGRPAAAARQPRQAAAGPAPADLPPASVDTAFTAAAPLATPASVSAPPWPVTARRLLLGIAALALLLAVFTRLPGVPYSVRALLNPYHPVAAPVLLAVFLFWMLGLPAAIARGLQYRGAAFWFPLAVAAQAIIGWALLREAVLPAMIHKVAGYPVLGWPGEWETLLRCGALLAALGLLLTGGCLTAWRATGREVHLWLLWTLLTLPWLHVLIVVRAATDNLTELLNDGWATDLYLQGWLLLVGATATRLAAGVSRGVPATRPQRPPSFLATVPKWVWDLGSVALGWCLLSLGLASDIEKYGQHFSALQFLLSTDRQHYATGVDLALRYLVFHAGVVGCIALAQWPWCRPSSVNRAAL